ncbi:MAG: hypothetical protein ACQERB_04915 [Promethearchaeati archaeon]
MNSEQVDSMETINSLKSISDMKEAIKGLAKIFEMSLDEDDFFRTAAYDNITILAKNIPKIFENLENKSKILKELKQVKLNQYQKKKPFSNFLK